MAASKKPSQILAELRKALEGTYSVKVALDYEESIDKLHWLKIANRDFLKVTPELEKAASQAMIDSIADADLSKPAEALEGALEDGGEAILEHICGRFKSGKRDVKMRPLSKGWIKVKGHNKIGIYKGGLINDLINGTVTITKAK